MRRALVPIAALAATSPAAAEVETLGDNGFVSRNMVDVAASPERSWSAMLRPGRWWSSEHTYSGNSAMMRIDGRVGGCFCERIPATPAAPAGQIEHMRVIHLAPHATLRMQGGLGPLQSEAITGVLTVKFERQGAGTRITWEYVVGGYMRRPMKDMAPVVDRVIKAQLERLKKALDAG